MWIIYVLKVFLFHILIQTNQYVPAWGNLVSFNMLANFLDDDALIYLESLDPEIWGNFELLRANLIEHYDTCAPMSTS